ncbi:SMP-30/gluconolactonase/LRE family protein [Thalassotalea piscium]
MRFVTFPSNTLLILLCLFINLGCSTSFNHKRVEKGIEPEIQIFDEQALRLIEPKANIVTISDGHTWTEGPVWISDGGYLLFSDIPNNVIKKFEPNIGTTTYLSEAGATGLFKGDYSAGSNGLLLNPKGELVLFQQGDRRVAVMKSSLDHPLSNFETLASKYQNNRLNSPNDGVFSSNGDLYFTDPPYGLDNVMEDAHKELLFQGVYLLKADGSLILLDDSLSFPNGVALSKDEKSLIVSVSDAKKAQWIAYHVKRDGTLEDKRVFYDATDLVGKKREQGLPDGLAVHSSGVIFATGPGGVNIFSQEGKLLAKIRTGKITSNCSLTSDEQTLYCTAIDTVLSIPLLSEFNKH